MKKHIIRVRDDFEKIEEYERDSKNVLEIDVFDNQGKQLKNISMINISFGKDAILGMGTELIRLHMENKKLQGLHLASAKNGFISEALGICISPFSPDVVFTSKELEINQLMEEKGNYLSNIDDILLNMDSDKIDIEELRYFIMTKSLLYGRLTYGSISFIKKSNEEYLLILDDGNISKESLITKEQISSIINTVVR